MKVKEEKDEVEKLDPGWWCQDPLLQPLPPCPHLHNNIILKSLPHDEQSSPLPPPSDPKNDRKQTKVRSMRVILIKQDAMFQRFKSRRGNRFQTKNISRYLLTSLWKQMRVLFVTRQLSEGQLRAVQQFGKCCSMAGLKSLIEYPGLKEKCLSYLGSPWMIRSLLGSSLEVKNKLIVVKYLQKMRRLIFSGELQSWKD